MWYQAFVMVLTDDFSQISDLCLKCKHVDLLITNTCMLSLTPVDKMRLQCEKFEKDTK